MRQTNTDCYGCEYNHNQQCIKDGFCTGVVPYKNYASSTSTPNYIPVNTTVPDEIEINGVKYKKVEE